MFVCQSRHIPLLVSVVNLSVTISSVLVGHLLLLHCLIGHFVVMTCRLKTLYGRMEILLSVSVCRWMGRGSWNWRNADCNRQAITLSHLFVVSVFRKQYNVRIFTHSRDFCIVELKII